MEAVTTPGRCLSPPFNRYKPRASLFPAPFPLVPAGMLSPFKKTKRKLRELLKRDLLKRDPFKRDLFKHDPLERDPFQRNPELVENGCIPYLTSRPVPEGHTLRKVVIVIDSEDQPRRPG